MYISQIKVFTMYFSYCSSYKTREGNGRKKHTHSFLQSRYALEFGGLVNKKKDPGSGVSITRINFLLCEKRKKKLTGRNPNRILSPLCYDVDISCSEKQLPGMDQSIRYISYFSKRKRAKKDNKTVSSFLCIYIYIYINPKLFAKEGGGERTYLLNVLSAFVQVEFSPPPPPPLLPASSAIVFFFWRK